MPSPNCWAVEVLSRRHGADEETTYRVGDLELDRLSHRWRAARMS